MPISHPSVLRDLSRETDRQVCHAWTCRRHVGAERGRDRRRRRFSSRPTTSIASARRCSSRRSIGFAPARSSRVFDATDRIQHMFWRIRERRSRGRRYGVANRDAIESCTCTTTRSSARSWRACGPDDVLLVLSDHGFAPFRRGVNVNSWLRGRGLSCAQARRRRHAASGCATWTGRRHASTRLASPACF